MTRIERMLRIAPGALNPPCATPKTALDLRVESDRLMERSGRYSPIRVIRDAPLGSECQPYAAEAGARCSRKTSRASSTFPNGADT